MECWRCTPIGGSVIDESCCHAGASTSGSADASSGDDEGETPRLRHVRGLRMASLRIRKRKLRRHTPYSSCHSHACPAPSFNNRFSLTPRVGSASAAACDDAAAPLAAAEQGQDLKQHQQPAAAAGAAVGALTATAAPSCLPTPVLDAALRPASHSSCSGRAHGVHKLKTRLRVPFHDLVFHEPIGSGSFKTVFRGRWGNTAVAIVRMRKGGLVTEARLMQSLGTHPNLVQFYRWSDDGAGNEYVVMELVPLGSLDKVLARGGSGLDTHAKLAMCEQICSAMCALCCEGVLHRDLAVRNILVQSLSPVHIKVSDFGLARDRSSAGQRCHLSTLPIRWTPPEVLRQQEWSEKSDVWAFGVTMWEIFSNGSEPYAAQSDADVVPFVTGGGRLPRPQRCPRQLYDLMLECWANDPAARPHFAAISERFRNWRKLGTPRMPGEAGTPGYRPLGPPPLLEGSGSEGEAWWDGVGGGGGGGSSSGGSCTRPCCDHYVALVLEVDGSQQQHLQHVGASRAQSPTGIGARGRSFSCALGTLQPLPELQLPCSPSNRPWSGGAASAPPMRTRSLPPRLCGRRPFRGGGSSCCPDRAATASAYEDALALLPEPLFGMGPGPHVAPPRQQPVAAAASPFCQLPQPAKGAASPFGQLQQQTLPGKIGVQQARKRSHSESVPSQWHDAQDCWVHRLQLAAGICVLEEEEEHQLAAALSAPGPCELDLDLILQEDALSSALLQPMDCDVSPLPATTPAGGAAPSMARQSDSGSCSAKAMAWPTELFTLCEQQPALADCPPSREMLSCCSNPGGVSSSELDWGGAWLAEDSVATAFTTDSRGSPSMFHSGGSATSQQPLQHLQHPWQLAAGCGTPLEAGSPVGTCCHPWTAVDLDSCGGGVCPGNPGPLYPQQPLYTPGAVSALAWVADAAVRTCQARPTSARRSPYQDIHSLTSRTMPSQ